SSPGSRRCEACSMPAPSCARRSWPATSAPRTTSPTSAACAPRATPRSPCHGRRWRWRPGSPACRHSTWSPSTSTTTTGSSPRPGRRGRSAMPGRCASTRPRSSWPAGRSGPRPRRCGGRPTCWRPSRRPGAGPSPSRGRWSTRSWRPGPGPSWPPPRTRTTAPAAGPARSRGIEGPGSAGARPGPGQQAPGDDQALDLVRALADDHERRVAVVALDRQVGRVADAAVDAHGLGGDGEGGLAGEELGHAGLDVAALAGLLVLGGVAGEQPGGLQPGGHVGQLELDGLVLGDGLAEGRALLGVVEGGVEGGPGDADGPGGDVDAAVLAHAEELGQAPPRLAHEVGGGDPVVGVGHLDRLDALVAELVDLPADRDAAVGRARLLLDDEGRDALVGAGGERPQAGPTRGAPPGLRSGDDG